jgi:hypothetical protein
VSHSRVQFLAHSWDRMMMMPLKGMKTVLALNNEGRSVVDDNKIKNVIKFDKRYEHRIM